MLSWAEIHELEVFNTSLDTIDFEKKCWITLASMVNMETATLMMSNWDVAEASELDSVTKLAEAFSKTYDFDEQTLAMACGFFEFVKQEKDNA